jgi:hypothetical protein
MDNYLANGYDGCENDYQRDNWKRNQRLIDFDFIPPEIEEQIIDKYNTVAVQPDINIVMDYLIRNRCNLLLADLQEF